MPDFTSALYLGMRHLREELDPWSQFTTGRPAALDEPAEARVLARSLAALQGREAAVLAPSTLHLAWDLFASLDALEPIAIYMDAGTYPVGAWGVERAACRGTPVQRFRHHRPSELREMMTRAGCPTRRPVVVTDGFCPRCGRPAPLREYLAGVEAVDGWLVVDDTQALGILGHSPDTTLPYGYDGGGSLRHFGIRSPRVLVLSSLAKGFGVPAAVLAGRAEAVAAFEEHGQTRIHCSPPSLATLRAGARALSLNRHHGNALRRCLAERVAHFRRRMAQAGLGARGDWFPVQTVVLPAELDPVRIHTALARRGVRVVLQAGRDASPSLAFLLTAQHSISDLDQAVAVLRNVCQRSFGQTPIEKTHHEIHARS